MWKSATVSRFAISLRATAVRRRCATSASRCPPEQSRAVVGPNGSGKSTLLKAVLGLTPEVSGEVWVGGVDANQARDRIAYVPQRELVYWSFPISAEQVVLMGRYPRIGLVSRGHRPRRSPRGVQRPCERVGMAPLAGRQIGALSGGRSGACSLLERW